MIGVTGFNPAFKAQNNNQNQNQNNSGGISPQFFGPPGPKDKMMDTKLCQQLGIDPAGMSREDVKANILSKLTGKPVEQMKQFFSNVGEQDKSMDLNKLNEMGINPSNNPNPMRARAENKANIVNDWIQGNNKDQANNTEMANKPQGKPPGKKQCDPSLLAALSSLGLSPSGSKENDYAQAMNHFALLDTQAGGDISQKQQVSMLKQAFLSIYASVA